MDRSLSALTASGSLANMLPGNYLCSLDNFGRYLCNVFDFTHCFAVEGAQEMFTRQACLGCSLISFSYHQNINPQLADSETICFLFLTNQFCNTDNLGCTQEEIF